MAQKSLANANREKPGKPIHPECVHHWAIEPAYGPFSKGICIKCGAQNYFRNSPPPSDKKEPARLE